MAYSGSEYWYVIYKALGDFGDLIADAAKAKAALQGLADSVKAEGAAEADAALKSAAARRTDVAAIKDERDALLTLAAAAKLANVQTEFGGRSSMEQHLSDQQQELNYEVLLNRQRWLLFSSPQQAYAWRQQEYNQRLLMNRAEWAGYASADQYLGYLQREVSQYGALNAALMARAQAYAENTDAALAYADALTGSHASVTQLGEGAAAAQASVTGLPSDVVVRLSLDDAGFIARMAADRAMLTDFSRTYSATEVLRASYELGGMPVTDSGPGVIPVSIGGPWKQQFADVLAHIAELNAMRADVPVQFDLPSAAEVAAFVASLPVFTERVRLVADGGPVGAGAGPPSGDASGNASGVAALTAAWESLSGAEAGAEAAATQAGDAQAAVAAEVAPEVSVAAAEWRKLGTAVQDAGAEAASAGPPFAGMMAALAAAGYRATAMEGLRQAVAGLAGTEKTAAANAYLASMAQKALGADAISTSADIAALAAQWANLTREEKNARVASAFGVAAAAASVKAVCAHPLRTGASICSNCPRSVQDSAAAVTAASAPPPGAAGEWAALAAAEISAGDAAAGAAAKMTDAADSGKTVNAMLGAAAGFLESAGTWWAALNAKILVFGGLMGAIAGWHLALDALLETSIVLVTAIGTLVLSLAAFAAVGYESAAQVYTRMKAVYEVFNATNEAIYPLNDNIAKFQAAAQPEVWQLYGDALDVVQGHVGVLGTLGVATGRVLDTMGARLAVDLNRSGSALSKFLADGAKNLANLGTVLVNIGHFFASLLMVAARTHIAEDLTAVVAALSGLLNVVSGLLRTKVGGWLAVLAIGLHGVWVWGGTAATAVLGAVRSLALLAGGTGEAESALGGLAATATPLQRFQAILADIGAGFGGLPGRISGTKSAIAEVSAVTGQAVPNLVALQKSAEDSGVAIADLVKGSAVEDVATFGKGLDQAGVDALNLAAAAGASQGQLGLLATRLGSASEEAKIASSATGDLATDTVAAAGATSLWGRALALLTSPVTWIVAAAAVIAVFTVKVATAKDATQQWIDAINTGLGQQSLFTVVGKTVADLAAVTQQLTGAQGLNAQAVHELTGAQSQLTGQLTTELTHTAAISRAYGTDMPMSLALLNAAGVKTSALFSRQSAVWATAMQQVAGLVTGYKAMGQGLTQLQGDVSVQLVMGAEQVTSMQKLNQAWDQWLTLVTGGQTSFVAFQQSLATTSTNAKAAGASMGGLNAASLTLRAAYTGLIPAAGTVLDSIRQQSAVLQNGAQGTAILMRATKDLAAEMIPLAGNNKAAQSSLLALVQEANPAVHTWQQLTKWVGRQGAAGAAQDLNSIMSALEQPVSQLAQDAAKLTTTLQSQLNPAMANAQFNAMGGQQAFNAFATDLVKFGPGSAVTVAAGRTVAQMLLSIDKNSGAAQDQFIAWAQSMGLSKAAAGKLWSEVDRGQVPLESMRRGLAASATASDNLAKSGFFAQVGDTYRQNFRQIGNFFASTLPDAIKTAANAWDGFWGRAYEIVVHDLGDPLASWFTGTLPRLVASAGAGVQSAWAHVWSAMVSPVVHVFDQIKQDITSGFDGWWKTHGQYLEQIWSSVTTSLAQWWHSFTGGLEQDWNMFLSWFKGGGNPSKAFTSMWGSLVTALHPEIAVVQSLFDALWGAIQAAAKIAWDAVAAAGKDAWDIMVAVFATAWDGLAAAVKASWDLLIGVLKAAWDIFVGVINTAIDLITGHWGQAWTDMKAAFEQANSAIDTAFMQAWKAIFAFLKQGWDNFSSLFTQLWNNLIGLLHQLWNNFWSWFDGTIVARFAHLFTSTFPGWWNELAADARTTWNDVWSHFSSAVLSPLEHFFTVSIPGWWDDLLAKARQTWTAVANWFTTSVAEPVGKAITNIGASLEAGFKNAVNWVITHIIDGVIGLVNKVLGVIPGAPKIPTVGTLAHGGDASGQAQRGSVPGTGEQDSHLALLTPGEWVMRKSARMALESKYGPGVMHRLNHADTWLGSGSRGIAASQAGPGAVDPGGLMVPGYAGGGGILGGIEGFLSGVGSTISKAASGLASLVTGGASELAKLAGAGAEAVFNGVWDATIGPLVATIGSSSVPGALTQGAADEVKHAVDSYLAGVDSKAQAKVGAPGGAVTPGLVSVAQYVLSHGGNKNAAAGIAGVIAGESGGNPEILQAGGGGGAGLLQWTPASSAAPYQPIITGNAARDMATQLADMLYYINQRGGMASINNAGSAIGSAEVFSRMEAPAVQYSDIRPSVVAQMVAEGYASGGPAGAVSPGAPAQFPGGMNAAQAWAQYSGQILPSDVSGESGAFWALNDAKLPTGKGGATDAQWAAWYAYLMILQAQQRKTIGLGSSPAGAYMALSEDYASPAAMTAGMWGTFGTDLATLASWQGGTGEPGGTIPPRSAWEAETGHPWPKGYKPGQVAPSGWAGWRYEHGGWSTLRTRLAKLSADETVAAQAWSALYGSGAAPGTPGVSPGGPDAGGGAGGSGGPSSVTVTAPVTGPGILYNLEPLVTQGGPAAPVFDVAPGGADSGFNASGVIAGHASGGLAGLAGMFALGGPVGLAPRGVSGMILNRLQGGGSQADPPRTLSAAGAAHSRIGMNVENLTIHNPVPEKPSMSIARASNRLAFLAGRGEA